MEYPPGIVKKLRQRIFDLNENDTSKDNEIAQLPPLDAFRAVLDWTLGGGWGDEIIETAKSCKLKVVEIE